MIAGLQKRAETAFTLPTVWTSSGPGSGSSSGSGSEILSDVLRRCKTSQCHMVLKHGGNKAPAFSRCSCTNWEPTVTTELFSYWLKVPTSVTRVSSKNFRSVISHLSKSGCNLFDLLLLAANFFYMLPLYNIILFQ